MAGSTPGGPSWDPQQYLRFEAERTQPARDLVARIADRRPRTAVDLGCGTGSSTALLRRQWPECDLTGLDRSAEMIAAARSSDASVRWVEGDIAGWTTPTPVDLVFSNAALHWLPDHRSLFPRLFDSVAPGGVLAVQMPVNHGSPAHRRIREVASQPRWAPRWTGDPTRVDVSTPDQYYDWLAPVARQVEVWETEYLHVLPDAAAIVEWVKGTTLRPYLTALTDPSDRAAFLASVREGIAQDYPPRTDGHVLFPFRRLFLVARR